MSAAKYTRSTYDALTEGFRKTPGNAAAAARWAGVDRRMALRAWKEGWIRHAAWARPIEAVLEEERSQAKAIAAERARAAQALADAEREKLRREHIETRAQEQQLVATARKDVLAGLLLSAEAVPTMRQLLQLARKDVEEAIAAGKTVDVEKVSKVFGRFADAVARLSGQARDLVLLGRSDKSAPKLDASGTPESDLTYDQALEELEAGRELLERLKGEGSMTGAGLLAGPGGDAAKRKASAGRSGSGNEPPPTKH